MTVAFDASVLIYVLNPKAPAPRDPATGAPVDRCPERVRYLLQRLQKSGERVVIPTPSLAEVLVRAEAAAPAYLTEFSKSRHFSVKNFDILAAVEHADIQRQRLASQAIPKSGVRPKAKFDDQIIAIARVAGVATIYSDDADIQKLAKHFGINALGVADLPLPPEDLQQSFAFPEANSEQHDEDVEPAVEDADEE